MADNIVIAGAARTAMGSMLGDFADVTASALGGVAIKAALENAALGADGVDELLMGNVLGAGQGQAPARQAGFLGGLSSSVPAVTLNKMCGSGMKAVMMAHDQLLTGNGAVLVAGGMESMTNAPHLLAGARSGVRMGHTAVIDHMMRDGLEDAYDTGRAMGTFAEDCAEKYQFTREAQDAYALESLARAQNANADGRLAGEIAPVTVKHRKGERVVTEDELPKQARPDKIPHLKPAFRQGGTVTAANASSISDGAAALVLMRESEAKARGATIRARILGHASHAQEPGWFTTAPVPAMRRVLDRAGWSVSDVDLWEVNEAFAVVPMTAMAEIGMDHDRLNVHGGACALGHPIGASGARIIVTLLNALETHDKATGIASLCIGGGEGTAIAIERI
ncbi:thiolase family protein [Oricola sp.]|uniref:thiolase family protein n=1 Tax=Oricola sp. TaxID=1979950 RepID=UPI003BAAD2FC